MNTLSILVLSIVLGMIAGSIVAIYSVLVMVSESERDMAIAGRACSAFELRITSDGKRIVRDAKTVASSACEPLDRALGMLMTNKRVFVQAADGNEVVRRWCDLTGGSEWGSAMGWEARK